MLENVDNKIIEDSQKVIYMNIGESYDKEWALKDEGIREGREETSLNIAK